MDNKDETSENFPQHEANDTNPENQGVTTTPAAQILGLCKGVLHERVKYWMDEHPEHLVDFNLETYESLQNNTEIDVASTAVIIYEDINAKIMTVGNKGKFLSRMQAHTLAAIIKRTARRCEPGEYSSPPNTQQAQGTSKGTEQGSTLPNSHLAPITPITQTQLPPAPNQAEPQQMPKPSQPPHPTTTPAPSPTKHRQRQQQNVQTKRASEQGALPQETGQQQQQQHLLYRPKRPKIVFDRGKLMSSSTLSWLQWFI